MNKKKGFTLIELLAVIVILGIISAIASSIVLGIIEDSRKESFARSAELVISALNIDITNKIFDDGFTYTITNGVISDNVKVNHTENMNGVVKYNRKGKAYFAINNGVYCAKKTTNMQMLEVSKYNGKCEVANDNGTVIYYDVLNGKICNNYHVDNSKVEYNGTEEMKKTSNQNSCLKFYIFNDSEESPILKLLLDHNTTGSVLWSDSSTQSNKKPIKVLEQLKIDTDSWVGTEIPKDYHLIQEGYVNYEIDYDNEIDEYDYKARLIEANEIAEITGANKKAGYMFDEKTTNSTNWFYLDSNSTVALDTCKPGNISGCNYGWLYDRTYTSCLAHGCLNNADSASYGYWTSTAAFGDNYAVWSISYGGSLSGIYAHYGNLRGVRPVIEVLKEKL